MVTVQLQAIITLDRKLVVDLPENLPPGPVEVVIQTRDAAQTTNPAREAARAALASAGALGTAHMPPSDMVAPTEDELRAAGERAVGGRPMHELIDEERGPK